jgi:hypothetical protein
MSGGVVKDSDVPVFAEYLGENVSDDILAMEIAKEEMNPEPWAPAEEKREFEWKEVDDSPYANLAVESQKSAEYKFNMEREREKRVAAEEERSKAQAERERADAARIRAESARARAVSERNTRQYELDSLYNIGVRYIPSYYTFLQRKSIEDAIRRLIYDYPYITERTLIDRIDSMIKDQKPKEDEDDKPKKTRAKSKSKPKAKSKAKSKSKPKAKSKSKPKAKSRSKTKAKSKVQKKSKTQSKS